MATHVKLLPSIGALWSYGLGLWVAFATGTYTSWAYATGSDAYHLAWDITVGLPAGGTDTFTLISMDLLTTAVVPITYPLMTSGWRAVAGQSFPDTLPSGDDAVTSYSTGPKSWKEALYHAVTSIPIDNEVADETNLRNGVKTKWWNWTIKQGLAVAIDGTCVVHGDTSAAEMVGSPTDIVAEETLTIQAAGGGGSVDLAPVVAALEDIATVDVTYTANNGGAIWSMRGKVAAT